MDLEAEHLHGLPATLQGYVLHLADVKQQVDVSVLSPCYSGEEGWADAAAPDVGALYPVAPFLVSRCIPARHLVGGDVILLFSFVVPHTQARNSNLGLCDLGSWPAAQGHSRHRRSTIASNSLV